MSTAIERILDWFERISAIPRCSKNEEAVARWFERWAQSRGWTSRRDPTGNLVIEVPASPGCEAAPGVVIQGHLDMVCERTPTSAHDFTRDPIRFSARASGCGRTKPRSAPTTGSPSPSARCWPRRLT